MFHFDGEDWTKPALPPEVGSYIRSIGGVPGEVQAITYGNPGPSPHIITIDDFSMVGR